MLSGRSALGINCKAALAAAGIWNFGASGRLRLTVRGIWKLVSLGAARAVAPEGMWKPGLLVAFFVGSNITDGILNVFGPTLESGFSTVRGPLAVHARISLVALCYATTITTCLPFARCFDTLAGLSVFDCCNPVESLCFRPYVVIFIRFRSVAVDTRLKDSSSPSSSVRGGLRIFAGAGLMGADTDLRGAALKETSSLSELL